MLAKVSIGIRYATRYVSATESVSKESSVTVADCSVSRKEKSSVLARVVAL
jgi:hypothetical protein